MKKICLLLILSIVLTGCVYESFRSLYGDEWMADHLPNQESADQSSDTGHIGATPIINISDNSDDQDDVTEDPSNDTIVPENTTTTTIRYTISFNAN
ncbi:MAG: hypothetical protein IKP67_00305, partial [Spirochaetales bacterium]|nr:hypothetical protein [Spirochaetales bacterium]